MEEQFEPGQRIYVDDSGHATVLHEAWVCKTPECGFIWAFTSAPTDSDGCDGCEKVNGWEWVA